MILNPELHLEIIGSLLILLALIHIHFAKYFKWKEECISLSLLNRQMMYIHTFFVALIVLMMGLLCLVSAKDLLTTILGKRVCLGLGVFWLARLVIQFFGYSPELWRGKRFETIVHILFSVMWVYFSGVFMYVAMK